MKLLYRLGLLLLFFIVIAACGNSTQKAKAETAKATTAIDLDARFLQTDSIVVVFYNDPYGIDSLRYTRFYKQFEVSNESDISVVVNDLKNGVKKEAQRRNCRGEGKIWFYKQQHVFQTVYFSTKASGCNYLYLINNGNLYYGELSDLLLQKLESWKQVAMAPKVPGN